MHHLPDNGMINPTGFDVSWLLVHPLSGMSASCAKLASGWRFRNRFLLGNDENVGWIKQLYLTWVW